MVERGGVRGLGARNLLNQPLASLFAVAAQLEQDQVADELELTEEGRYHC